jgi:hypothetical protein
MSGLVCPFCKTKLASGANVCAACGAEERTRPINFGRIMLWCNSVGVVLLVWLSCPFMVAEELNKRNTDWTTVAMLSGLTVGGFWIFKFTVLIWVKIFGRISDKLWYR